MTNALGAVFVASFGLAVFFLVLFRPVYLSDSNGFLEGFVNHELLAIMGVIISITVASALNILIELRRIESENSCSGEFDNTRSEIERGSKTLLWLLFAEFILVIAKGAVGGAEIIQALFNGLSLWFIFWQGVIMFSLVDLSFRVGRFRL